MTCIEPAEQDGLAHQQWHKLGSARPSWYQEDSVHVSVRQMGRKPNDRDFIHEVWAEWEDAATQMVLMWQWQKITTTFLRFGLAVSL